MRTPQAGETIVTRIKASFPAPDGRVVRDGLVMTQFWAPGRDPKADPVARTTPDYVAECTFDQRLSGWVARVSTEGWVPGTWTLRARVCAPVGGDDLATGWDWATFELAA